MGVVLFNITQSKLPAIHRSSPIMIPISIVAFTLVGVMAMYFPEILGNGKAGNELTFTNDITWTYALGLFGAKWGCSFTRFGGRCLRWSYYTI